MNKFCQFGLAGSIIAAAVPAAYSTTIDPPELGNFSVSLTVKDIGASKAFYEKLGFIQVDGSLTKGWAIMNNGATKIGLFQGMFERNTLTFNPGWDQNGMPNANAEDIRSLQQRLKRAGLETGAEIKSAKGPASFAITDPDGNPILFDQHF